MVNIIIFNNFVFLFRTLQYFSYNVKNNIFIAMLYGTPCHDIFFYYLAHKKSMDLQNRNRPCEKMGVED